MTEGPAELDADTYIRLHQDHRSALLAYARTLIGTPWPAEDTVAEAYFLVWRRLRSGEPVDDVPAALKATVRDLARSAASRDRAQRVSYVDLLARVIEELPQRWVKALWQGEAERQPPVAAGRRPEAGASPAAALERARDGARQHFLRAQPGTPADPACGWCWERLPEHVRGVDSPSQAEQVAVHVAGCADCRARTERLMAADARLSALLGPALLTLLARGTADYLVPLARAGGAVAALSAGGAHAAPSGALTAAARSAGHLVRRRVTRAGRPVAVAAGAGALALAGAAVAAGLVLTGGDTPGDEQRTAASAPDSGFGSPPWGQEATRSDPAGHGKASGGAPSGRPGAGSPSGAADRSPERSPSSPPSSPASASPSSPSSSAPDAPGSASTSAAPSTPSGSGATPTRPPATRPTAKPSQSATPKPTKTPEPTGTTTAGPTATPTESPSTEPAEPTAQPTPTDSAKPAKPAKPTEQPPAAGRDGRDGWENG
ncbi:zf-HC2 domain-containing protein [Streptomyces sparsogenes]|uniref:zf-HC2 domain-containing protein n=1 Tax=Streptomyces sparsogenes TaxID=67365 RepID=UPI0033D42151